ncbi:uncharacterized protein LOC124149582 [Haliotis rufescens]|uniref:uncharacterized protein LOC124149582 n=1 Tax=Haliotis rufescens TaxID=6454 RepID=UPI001EB00EC9|nr:uncharacterized protein LOC124149582 [Haliotis rufescens]
MATTTLTRLPQPPPKLTGGKRGPSLSSDEDDTLDSPRNSRNPVSPRQLHQGLSQPLLSSAPQTVCPPQLPSTTPPRPTDVPLSPTSPSISTYGCEHDHDYENVASPNSSTASGPIYVRPPGFKHHAQAIEAKSRHKKKKTTTLLSLRDGLKKREQTPPKYKARRDPLPMRCRALPQSFWQQPNVPHQVSPGTMFPVLPPLMNGGTEEDTIEMRPVTPPEERTEVEDKEHKRPPRAPDRKVTVTNTDLLFRLFDGVGEEVTKKPVGSLKRGRPKKLMPKSNTKGLLSGNDPYLVDAMTDKLFPNLSLEGRHGAQLGNTSLQLITVRGDGDKTVTLPALSFDQNYSQMLSELVMHI